MNIHHQVKILFVFSILLISSFLTNAFADTVWLPESRHQQFTTYALFIDNQSTLLYQSSGRAWASVDASIALLEKTDLESSPQLIFHGSANSGFRMSSNLSTLLTETTDARVSLLLQGHKTEHLRWSAGWMHYSGHISDNVADPELIGPNIGFEQLFLRVVADYDDDFRVGGTLKPFIGTDPGLKTFAADQFIEWYPWGTAHLASRPTPFLALGLEEYGRRKIDPSVNLVAGAYMGNHLHATHKTSMRYVLGYYAGPSPQLKYMAIKDEKTRFLYTGIIFEL